MTIYIGLMSGTSCDGLDIAGVKINNQKNLPSCELLFFSNYAYTNELKEKLLHYAVSHFCKYAHLSSIRN